MSTLQLTGLMGRGETGHPPPHDDGSRITWLLKEALYRDRSWETSCTLGSALLLFFGMGSSFWVNMVLVVSGEQLLPSVPVM